jgi:hypothetical protein
MNLLTIIPFDSVELSGLDKKNRICSMMIEKTAILKFILNLNNF